MLSKQHFMFVEYNGIPYPLGYKSEVCEVAGHFDNNEIEVKEVYSLHTEYSYGKRKFNSELISQFPVLVEANKNGIPQLWKSIEWADSFAEFIILLTKNKTSPRIIEIHPPFNDYCTMNDFLERYSVFEKRIHSVYPNVQIVIENRAGATYRGGKFLVSKAKDIVELCNAIKENDLRLGIVLDFPQLLTAENINPVNFKKEKYLAAIDTIAVHRDLIQGIHIWGKRKSATGRWVAHCGNLDTYFAEDEDTKACFVKGIASICSDGKQRFLVPEVNSGEKDLELILADLFIE